MKNKQYNTSDYVSVGLKDKKTGGQKTKFIRTNIFNDGNKVDTSTWSARFREYMIKKLILMRPEHKRFNKIHTWLKQFFLYNIITLSSKIINKYLITKDDDIDRYSHNNHIRMFRWAWGESVKDIWRIYVYRQKKFKGKLNINKEGNTETSDDIVNNAISRNRRSYMARQLAKDVFVTEMLEDTADREWCNYFVLRLTHEIMKFYGVGGKARKKVPVPGEYPVYESQDKRHINYFMQFIEEPTWIHPDHKDLIRQAKKMSNKRNKGDKR